MDEIAKAEARNYVSMAGFILLGLFGLILIFGSFDSSFAVSTLSTAMMVLGSLVLIMGIFLAILGNRGLTTIFFIAEGMMLLITSMINGFTLIIAGANLVLAILMLFGTNGKKLIYFLLALVLVPIGLTSFFGWPSIILTILSIITCVLYFWFAIACAAERTGFPGRNLICEDEAVDFKTSGSVLGYLMFAMVCAVWVVYYFLSESIVPLAGVEAVKLVCGSILILLAILLFAIAKMRFTPMIFLLTGTIFIISTMVGGIAIYAFGAVLVLLGIIAFLRQESRVLLALFLILYGLTFFISVLITGNYSLGIFHGIINLIPGLVALYLAFAVFAQKKNLLV
ncbi:MAG TPA: hypothetical protein O0X27_05245 [Methanocorpusculum sp.]|nr:hypothetical protein [Methanocorpusculum sp.]